MSIAWSEVTDANLDECLNVAPAHLGHELVGEAVARRVWKELVRLPFIITGALVQPRRACEIVGFGLGCMVSPEFTRSELSHPRAGTNARFIHASGCPIVLNRSEIARANASDGVDVLQLYGTLREGLSEEEQFEAVPLMWSKYVEYMRGHRVRGAMCEVRSTSERRFTRGSGTELIPVCEADQFLSYATRSTVAAVPSSAGFGVFNYMAPVLRLRETDQDLLLAALSGLTDEELSSRLRLTQNAVKARWRSVLARTAAAKPELVAQDDYREGRGSQKRHRVLAYVREHYEELRPYDWRVHDGRAPAGANGNAGHSGSMQSLCETSVFRK